MKVIFYQYANYPQGGELRLEDGDVNSITLAKSRKASEKKIKQMAIEKLRLLLKQLENQL